MAHGPAGSRLISLRKPAKEASQRHLSIYVCESLSGVGEARVVLVFDGTCGVCTRMARWVRRRARAGSVQAVAGQAPGVLERFGLTRNDADRAAWAIEPGGRRLEGAAAVNRCLEEFGGAWSLVGALYGAAPVRIVEDAAYGWFARHRSRFERFGVTPECDEPGAGCA